MFESVSKEMVQLRFILKQEIFLNSSLILNKYRQVVHNLIQNAVDAAGTQGRTGKHYIGQNGSERSDSCGAR
jgi:hypothetical protein